jgi:hypothetical protein
LGKPVQVSAGPEENQKSDGSRKKDVVIRTNRSSLQ